MSKLLLLPLAALLAGSTGCATLLANKTDSLSVSSNPPGAQVLVDGAPQGVTPTRIEVDKKHPPRVEVAMPGFVQQSCPVRMSAGVGYAVADVALCLFIFPIGCISFIDASGAWNELDKDSCSVALQPDQGGYPQQGYPQQRPPQTYPGQPYPQPYPGQQYPQQQYPQQQPYPPPPPPTR